MIFLAREQKDKKVLKAMNQLDDLYFCKTRPAHWEYALSLCICRLWLEATERIMEFYGCGEPSDTVTAETETEYFRKFFKKIMSVSRSF